MEPNKQERQISFELAEEILAAAAQLSVEVEQQKDKTSFSLSEIRQIAHSANIPPECVEQALNDSLNNPTQFLELSKCLGILLVAVMVLIAFTNLTVFVLIICLALPIIAPLTLLPVNLFAYPPLWRKNHAKNS